MLKRVNIYTAAPINSPVADIAHRLNTTTCLVVVLPLSKLGPERQQLLAAQATLQQKLAQLNRDLELASSLLDEQRRLDRLARLLPERDQCQAQLATVAAKLQGEATS